MLNIFIVMVGVGLITPILPELIIEFDANGQAMGLLVAAYGITQFCCPRLQAACLIDMEEKHLFLPGLSFSVLRSCCSPLVMRYA